MQTSSIIQAAVAVGVAAGLAACGGGGGDAGNPVADASPLVISAANHEAVARQMTQAASDLLDTGSLVSGAQVAPSAKTLISVSRSLLARVPELLRNVPQVVGGVTVTEQLPCSGSGSILATANDLNANGRVDSGDSGRLVANNCVEFGAMLNGTVGVAFSKVSGDLFSGIYSANVAVTLNGLQAVTAAGNVSGSGSLTLAMASAGADRATLDIQVPLLAMSGQVGGFQDALTLQNWRATSSTVPGANGPTVSVSTSGTFISSALGGKPVSVATGVPLVLLWGDTQPSSGRFTATGAAGSQVRVTALNAGIARIELDAGGDGLFETSVDRAWHSLF